MQTIWVVQVLLVLFLIKAVEANVYSIAKPGCPKSCGGVMIPYPFGIGPNCSMNTGFAVTCDYSTNRTGKPYLASTTFEVLGISVRGQVRVNSSVISNNCGFTTSNSKNWVDLSGTPYIFSGDRNRFTATGCYNYARLVDPSRRSTVGCLSMCNYSERSASGCYGLNCCQTTIPPDIKSFEARMGKFFFNRVYSRSGCISSFMVEQSWFEEALALSRSNVIASQMEYVPAVLEWGKDQGSCDISTMESDQVFCSGVFCWKMLSYKHLCACTLNVSSSEDSIEYIMDGGCPGPECLKYLKGCRLLCMHTPRSSNCPSCPDGYFATNGSSYSSQIYCFPPDELYVRKHKAKFIMIGEKGTGEAREAN